MTILTRELLDSFDSSITDVATAETLPPVIYTNDEFLEFEREAIFAKEWLCAGRASRIPNPGDWFSVELNNEQLLITRGKDGEIRALSNVCQHRGMKLAEGSGNCTKFTCVYHLWSFDLTGRLLGAPAMERTKDFDKKQYPLPSCKVELWKGFIFVNFDADAAPLAPTLERYTPYLDHYDLEDTVCPDTIVLKDLPWNWKVMFENFNDAYHANKLHHTIQDFCPSELARFPEPWVDSSNVMFRTNDYIHIDGGFNGTTKALMPIFPKLTEQERQRSTFALLPPNLCFGTAPDQAFFFIVHPKTANTIDVEIGYLFHPTALENPMFEYLLKLSDAGVQVFVQQDQDATRRVQLGLKSRWAPRGRYSWQEETHVQFNKWLVQRYRRHWPTESVAPVDAPRLRAVGGH